MGVGGWGSEVGVQRWTRYRFEMKIGVLVDEMEVQKAEVEDNVGGETSDFR